MRVLFIPSWFPTKSNPYAGSFIKRLADDLVETGIEIEVLHFDFSYKTLGPKRYEKKIEENDLIVHHLTGFSLPKINAKSQSLWIKKCVEQGELYLAERTFDFIHSHDYVASFVGDVLAQKMSIPHVCTMHHSDFIEDTIPKWRTECLQGVLERAKCVVSPSHCLSDKIQADYGVTVETIGHYIHWEVEKKRELGQPKKAITVTSTEKVKNNEALIRFCEEKEIEIDIYGAVEKRIKSTSAKIIFKGKVEHRELQKLYKNYDYFISFSHVETFGLAVLEALSHGLPVIAKNQCGAKDLITEKNGIILNTPDDFLLFQNKYSNYNSQEISSSVAKKFNKENILKKYLDLIYD